MVMLFAPFFCSKMTSTNNAGFKTSLMCNSFVMHTQNDVMQQKPKTNSLQGCLSQEIENGT